MTLSLIARYPGRVITTDPDFPLGKARNITNPGDGTGTPWEADLVNDLHGTLQALLAEAGITASGNPDKVGTSDVLDALNILFQRQAVFAFITLNSTLKTAGSPFDLSLFSYSTGVSIASNAISFPRTGVYSVSGSFSVTPASGSEGTNVAASGGAYKFNGAITAAGKARLTGSFPFVVNDISTDKFDVRPVTVSQTPESASPSNQTQLNQILITRLGDV